MTKSPYDELRGAILRSPGSDAPLTKTDIEPWIESIPMGPLRAAVDLCYTFMIPPTPLCQIRSEHVIGGPRDPRGVVFQDLAFPVPDRLRGWFCSRLSEVSPHQPLFPVEHEGSVLGCLVWIRYNEVKWRPMWLYAGFLEQISRVRRQNRIKS